MPDNALSARIICRKRWIKSRRCATCRWSGISSARSRATRRAAIAEHFDWVHSVDRLKIAERLSAHSAPPDLPPLNVCLQVNVSGEASKSGVAPDVVLQLARTCGVAAACKLRGLMAIPGARPKGCAATRTVRPQHARTDAAA